MEAAVLSKQRPFQRGFSHFTKANRQREPTPYSHEDSKEHGASVIKQMGHLKRHNKKHNRQSESSFKPNICLETDPSSPTSFSDFELDVEEP